MKTTYQWVSFIVFWLDDSSVIRKMFAVVPGLSGSRPDTSGEIPLAVVVELLRRAGYTVTPTAPGAR